MLEKKVNIQLSESGQADIPAVILAEKRRLEELRGLLKHKGKPLSDEQLCAPVDLTKDKK
jgi:hypothetical protein